MTSLPFTKPWAAGEYDKSFSFVANYGRDLIPLLAPKRGERILDLGCGTGKLTAEIAKSGATLLGLDADENMLATARKAYPNIAFVKGDATRLTFKGQFDAVFSNAALHWMLRPKLVLKGVAKALKPGARFVAEMGGYRNCIAITDATIAALRKEGIRASVSDCWYFPTLGQQASLLEAVGLTVSFATYFDRLTPLEGGSNGIRQWLEMFGTPLLQRAPVNRRSAIIKAIEKATRPELYRDGRWHADYRRLRFIAIKL